MGIQLEFYVVLLIWLSMLGSPQIPGGIIGNSFFSSLYYFKLFLLFFLVYFRHNSLISHVVRKNFLNSVKWEDVCHYLSLIVLFFGFYRAINHIRCLANRETAKNESEKFRR